MTLWCHVTFTELHQHDSAALLIARTRSSRIHRRRWRSQSLIHKQLDLNASILRTAFFRCVLRNWLHFTVAVWRNNPAQWDVVVLDQVTNNRIRPTLAQRTIKVNASSRVSETRNLEHVALGVQSLTRNVVQRCLRLSQKHCTA